MDLRKFTCTKCKKKHCFSVNVIKCCQDKANELTSQVLIDNDHVFVVGDIIVFTKYKDYYDKYQHCANNYFHWIYEQEWEKLLHQYSCCFYHLVVEVNDENIKLITKDENGLKLVMAANSEYSNIYKILNPSEKLTNEMANILIQENY